ncbi:MAG: assimilatory nitrate reductase catalytic subunit, partial [Gammaproteobacteria bacterium]
MESTTTSTTCPYCGVGCGLLVTRDRCGQVTTKGDPEHPSNFGRICSKGAALGETVATDGRLAAPIIDGQESNWDAALGRVASEFASAIEQHGPDSVAFYVSGQLLTEDYYVANKLMKGYIGTANIDTNSRLCMASSVAGHRRAFGADTVPGTYTDLELADLIVITGSNLAWCHPVLYQRIAAAKEARTGLFVVVIDPRRTATCEIADLHLAIKPDTDVVLFNGLLAHLKKTGSLNDEYIREHVTGVDAALSSAGVLDEHDVSVRTGLEIDLLREFFARFACTERTVTIYSQGVNQSENGTDKVNAIINCHLVTGRIGSPGCGPFSVTGQPNAMGGREVGGLANQLACHMDLDNLAHRDLVQRFWNSPNIAQRPGLKAVDLFEACRDGRIKALWIIATNPVDSLPNGRMIEQALQVCPFVVVSDVIAATDTGRFANVLLPAQAWGEKEGTVTNSERRISRQRSFLLAPGASRPDWWIIKEVAVRLGFADAFDYSCTAEIFREYAHLSTFENNGTRDFDIGGLGVLSNAQYEDLTPIQWPVPVELAEQAVGEKRLFSDGQFFTRSGRANCVAVATPAIRENDLKYPLVMNTGRVRDQWHTMTRTGRAPRLGSHYAEPFAEIHPRDAAEFGIEPASLITVENPNATVVVRALVTERQQRGSIFVPMHWSDQYASSARLNRLVSDVVDPISGQPALKSAAVGVSVFAATWYGFLVTENLPSLVSSDYWALCVTNGGWRAELAGLQVPRDWDVMLNSLLNRTGDLPTDHVQFFDAARGARRYIIVEAGRIVAMAYFATSRVCVSRQWAVDQLSSPGDSAISVIAGRAPADVADAGATVCSCFSVGRNEIITAIV